jgi:hypothetical protein
MPLRLSLVIRFVLAWVMVSLVSIIYLKVFGGPMAPALIIVLDWVYAPLFLADAVVCLAFPAFVNRFAFFSRS